MLKFDNINIKTRKFHYEEEWIDCNDVNNEYISISKEYPSGKSI